jgi:amino acid permease
MPPAVEFVTGHGTEEGGAVMIPSFILSAVWFTNSIGGQYLLKLADSMSWQRVVLWVIGLSAVTILFVWISIKVSYAKHVGELKENLRELEEG